MSSWRHTYLCTEKTLLYLPPHQIVKAHLFQVVAFLHQTVLPAEV